MPAAWYPDPSTPGQLRWWDGAQWTTNVTPQTGAAGAPGGQRRPYATFWQRAGALILDSLILAVPFFVLAIALGSTLVLYGNTGGFNAGALLLALVFQAVAAAYFIYLIGEQGRTLGMRALNIRVINAAGQDIGLENSAKRWVIPGGLSILSALPVLGILASLGGLINYLSMLWSDENQCWHDKFAQTWVVQDK